MFRSYFHAKRPLLRLEDGMSSFTRRDLMRSGVALTASALAANSLVSKAHAWLSKLPGGSLMESFRPVAPRERYLFDFGWKFTFGNGSDPAKDLGFGSTQEDFAKSGEFKFSTEKFDDSKWRGLDLPHDWAVELPFVRDESLQSHGYKPLGRRFPETSVGWYRRSFDIPESDRGRRILIEFDGGFRDALVFVNGYFIGRNNNGYAPFTFDLTDFVVPGARNYIVVRMDASFGDGWFYEGAGIYRHVWLAKTDALHLGQWESYVRTDLKGDTATLNLGTVVENQGTHPESCRVRWQIVDSLGKAVASADCAPQQVAANGSARFVSTARLSNPA